MGEEKHLYTEISNNMVIQHPRQWVPPLPKNLGNREARVLYMSVQRCPFSAPFFTHFRSSFSSQTYFIVFLRVYWTTLSKTACWNSSWFKSYDTLKMAVLGFQIRSPSSPSSSSSSAISPHFFQSSNCRSSMKFCMYIPYAYLNMNSFLVFQNSNFFSKYSNFSGLDLEIFWKFSNCRSSMKFCMHIPYAYLNMKHFLFFQIWFF